LEKLNLTDAQKKDFQNLNTDFAKQRVEQQSKIKLAAIDLRSLMKADTPDKAAIEKKINEISDLQAQNRLLRVDHWFAVNKILNPDQQKLWKEMLDRPFRAGFRGGRMGQMHAGRVMRPYGRMMPQGNPNQ
jgi:Spy/CpxP family protein refolding chaperone